MSSQIHHSRLRHIGRRAPHRQSLGRMRSRQPQEPAQALRAPHRTERRERSDLGSGRHHARPAPAATRRRHDWLDGVLYTHDHADHTHGIDDLRQVAYNGNRRVDVYHDAATGRQLRARFAYCFDTPPASEYPAILKSHEIRASEAVRIAGAGGAIEALPFRQIHGSGETLGFRFGGLAYSPDVSDFPGEVARGARRASIFGSSIRCVTSRIRAISRWSRRSAGSRA